jgi:hypothetical protein
MVTLRSSHLLVLAGRREAEGWPGLMAAPRAMPAAEVSVRSHTHQTCSHACWTLCTEGSPLRQEHHRRLQDFSKGAGSGCMHCMYQASWCSMLHFRALQFRTLEDGQAAVPTWTGCRGLLPLLQQAVPAQSCFRLRFMWWFISTNR